MLRIDNEQLTAISDENEALLLEQVRRQLDHKPVAVILSDYAKGTLTRAVTQEIIPLANQAGILDQFQTPAIFAPQDGHAPGVCHRSRVR